jgi:hypothetical protein
MVETLALQAKKRAVQCGRMKRDQLGAHTKHDLEGHLVWVPRYRKRVLTGEHFNQGFFH